LAIEMNLNEEILQRARKIKLLLLDCDGVLTDGRLYFTEAGETMKVFHVRDGLGLVSWHRTGGRSGIISGRNSPIVEIRAKELGIEFVRQGVEDKIKVFEEILSQTGILAEETAFVGDDVPDISLFERVGLAIAVADAVEETKASAHFITTKPGGNGAVREVTGLLLQSKIKETF
jgi:3-deoxy-D-manno-octulosonate 8-phosphate phosphatase (KDO 8-P phosphatase)